MRIASKPSSRIDRRVLRLEILEDRAMLSASATFADFASILKSLTVNSNGDYVIPVHAQVGDTAVELVLGIAKTLDTVEDAINAYLSEIPGWHVTGDIDTSPEYSGVVDGSITISAAGILKSANLSVTASADIGGAVEGYYGISVLHIGAGAAADLSANISATASYSVDTNKWCFSGSADLDGYVKGYASATAWPLKGEIYIKGDITADASVSSSTGLATASISVVGSVGADAQIKSLFGGWKTIASTSKTLGAWGCSVSYDIGSWIKSGVGEVTTTVQAFKASAAASSLAQTQATFSSTVAASSGSTVASESATSSDKSLASETTVASTTSVLAQSVANSLTTSVTSDTAAAASNLAVAVHSSALAQVSEELLLAC